MSIFQTKIKHPGTAFVIYFLIGAVLARYGIRDGTMLLIALFAGIFIYKLVTA